MRILKSEKENTPQSHSSKRILSSGICPVSQFLSLPGKRGLPLFPVVHDQMAPTVCIAAGVPMGLHRWRRFSPDEDGTSRRVVVAYPELGRPRAKGTPSGSYRRSASNAIPLLEFRTIQNSTWAPVNENIGKRWNVGTPQLQPAPAQSNMELEKTPHRTRVAGVSVELSRQEKLTH